VHNAVQHSQFIRFGTFEVDLEAGELRRNGLKVRLIGQPFQVLAILLEHPGHVVTREELQKRLWPDTVVEVEHSLNTAINKIREALGDSAENPRFVETLPRRGYRFIAPVCAPPDSEAIQPDRPAATPDRDQQAPKEPIKTLIKSTRKWILLSAATTALLGLAALALWIRWAPLPPPRITDYAQLTNDGRARNIGGTDGSKLFVNAFAPEELAQVSTSDGRSVPFHIDIPDAKQCASSVPSVRDVSFDGSRLLVLCPGVLNENQVWIVGAIGRPARLLTTAQDAAWSSDGKSVVYSTTDGALYRMTSEGGESRLLVPPVVPKGQYIIVRDLAWSPNGSLIRFSWQRAIWEVSANGGTPHRLLASKRWPQAHCCGRWTKDGDFFIYLYGDTSFSGCVTQCGAQLWAVDERHGRLRRPNPEPIPLLGGPTRWADPTPSSDGKRIFARGITVRGELVRYNAQVKQLKPFLGSISAQELAFSHNGKHVAYGTFPDGGLWKADRDGSNVVQLRPPSKDHAAAPSWSPDDSQILYVAAFGAGQNAIFSVSANGGTPTPLLSEKNGFYSDPNWSPDGQQIVFATVPIDEGLPLDLSEVKIKIFDLKTKKVTVVPHSEGMFSPRWSPDGRYIAGLTIENGELRVYDLKTQTWRGLAMLPVGYPAWSSDSGSICALVDGEAPGVYRFPVSGGSAQLTVDLRGVRQTGWWGQWFGLDPTDAPLLLRDAGSYEIYALTLERE
jgi:DNA-binding winged helix-turn-helix (wHTH) protein/Tol biopolymer transport system component